MSALEVRVPNIGDFSDVPVIDVLVKPGDRIAPEDPLIVLESEKATMEVPSPQAGVVASVNVAVGDKVSEGTTILTVAADAPAASAPSPASASNGAAPPAPPAPAPAPASSVVELRVPDIGDFKDVPIVDVFVRAGDLVEREAPLVTLESEKATMDVPASEAGTIADVAVKPGDRVSQGSLIATIRVAGAQAPAPSMPPAAPASAPSAPPPGVPAIAPSSAPVAAASGGGARVHASPMIRKLARELGVDLAGLRGSGPNGRITRDDVHGFVKRALAAPSVSGQTSPAGLGLGIPPWPKVDFAQYGPIERKPLGRIKKISGPVLHRNWVTIPHVTNNDEADITDLEALRVKLNAEQGKDGVKVTILAFVIKAVTAALARYPELNASLDGDDLVYKRYYHIGFAADTPGGLLVPVVKNADAKGVLEIARETSELAKKAREGKLGPADMAGGTFTISSLGGIGGTSFSPIVNAPEVAILGTSRSAMKPVWDGLTFVPRLMLPLSLSYDHRVIDGALAARFNAYLATVLADMRRALL